MSTGMYLVKDLDKALMAATRDGFGQGLVEAGRMNENVVALCADLTDSTRIGWFADEFPERFVQVGIAEQNMATVASGMAAMGKIPFAASYAAFSPGRNWEQIKTTAALNNQPVNIVGAHAGLYTGADGATHQMLEDIAMMRAMPNMVVVCPGDSIEAQKATIALANDSRPSYLRCCREKTPVFTSNRTPFDLKRAFVLKTGKDLTIVSTGTMTVPALRVAERLEKEGLSVEVIHAPVIKPLDGATILTSAQKTGAVVTMEEAQVIGGLGGAVAELLSETQPTPLKRLGVNDRFGESGDPKDLFAEHGLDDDSLLIRIHAFLQDIGKGKKGR